MSLNFATLSPRGLLVSADGVASDKADNILYKDMRKIFKITDNLIIFIGGIAGSNLEVIEIIQNIKDKSVFDDIDSTENAIIDACKTVWERHKDKGFVQSWLLARDFGFIDNEGNSGLPVAIPIALSCYYYDKSVQAYFYMGLSPENDFKPKTFNLTFGQTIIKGFKNKKAQSLLKKYRDEMSTVITVESEINKFEKVYRDLEVEDPSSIGGVTTYYLMGFNETKIIYQGGNE
ncbi:Ntn hydrolase family protein [Schinkia azotoformans]|uniref:hypothetical protein n=1 Tax=Schinkia azotoformans TaxID=1454 RepID=UPI002DB629A9|nr:hypothetical protein [Schinkia azotoformans]MEC1772817.1 hypothetical protein [Schinkia azotoformans]MED4367464.1 hypothetical protein [Schinkia azotoformans]